MASSKPEIVAGKFLGPLPSRGRTAQCAERKFEHINDTRKQVEDTRKSPYKAIAFVLLKFPYQDGFKAVVLNLSRCSP